MSTGTSVQVIVDLVQKTITYTVNILLQMGYRIESGRGLSGYMSQFHEIIERGFRAWVTEGTLLWIIYEIFDPQSDEAYEHGKVTLTYTADPTEKVVKPPLEQLESLFKTIKQLPPGAQFRVVVHTAEGASEVPGWQPTRLKELKGGLAEELEVGDEEHGFGRIKGKLVYRIGNWDGDQQDQHDGVNEE